MEQPVFPAFSDIHNKHLLRSFAYINGQWVSAAAGQSIAVHNPADGGYLGEVTELSAAESHAAVAAAADAFAQWSNLLPQERAAILRRWYELMLENAEDMARIMTYEQGKPLSEARGEISYGASFVEFYAEESKRPNIESVTSHMRDAEMELWREPAGVAALITPWNFPMAMITRKAAAALAAGCTVLVHPSMETPFSALLLAELAEQAGIPAGVFNVITGDAATVVGPWLDDKRVRVLSFTGSTEVGKHLYARSAQTMKKLVLELGGHAPFIVFADADMEQAVDEAIKAKFATSGQDCLAANRIYIEQPVYEKFCRLFAARTEALTVGAGLDDPDIGPLMNANALSKQQEQVADALAKGARCLCGGEKHSAGELFYQPTVLADVPTDALIMQEETFGPVAALSVFENEEQVTAWANDTDYGLVAYLHTQNPGRIYRMSRALNFGMVAINRTKVTGAPIPFGGNKQSGLGREGARSGMEEFTTIKYVCRDWA
ncbi:MAG: NAD-dependent succinate-semialdehyde dehydrogenase [Thiolinea sp.]